MRSLGLFLAVLLCCGSLSRAAAETKLFVLPSGDDAAAGSREAPLASLAGARDRIRQLRSEGITGPVTVAFGRGTYFFNSPVSFSKQDSGSEAGPVTYLAAAGQPVHFTAGRSVTGWQPVTDQQVLARLPEVARQVVRVADLRVQGIGDYGTLKVHGFAGPNPPAVAELFFQDQPMSLARWPNEGFRGLKKVVNATTLLPDTDRTKQWQNEADPWVFAYWHHDWAELFEPLTGIAAETGALLRSETVKPQYGITANRARWYAANLLCELDAPGEYYLDRKAGRLYFWPPGGASADLATTVLSMGEGVLRAADISHVRFQGFTLEACRGTAVRITGGNDCQLVGCTIRNIGHSAVSFSGGQRHTVYGCDIHDCGTGGIGMAGGDRKTLTPASHTAENNHVFRYSRRARRGKRGPRDARGPARPRRAAPHRTPGRRGRAGRSRRGAGPRGRGSRPAPRAARPGGGRAPPSGREGRSRGGVRPSRSRTRRMGRDQTERRGASSAARKRASSSEVTSSQRMSARDPARARSRPRARARTERASARRRVGSKGLEIGAEVVGMGGFGGIRGRRARDVGSPGQARRGPRARAGAQALRSLPPRAGAGSELPDPRRPCSSPSCATPSSSPRRPAS
jgi:hypothetical protein